MSESNEENMNIEVGDIIEIESPSNIAYHEKQFLIHYLDEKLLTVIHIETLEKLSVSIDNGKLTDESITAINILDKPENKGFAINNNLVPGQWIDIHFKGDVPMIITGEITNLEEDMIELTLYPKKDMIYIDFAYKGIPKDLDIDNINIRDKPVQLVEDERQLTEIKEEEEIEPKTEGEPREDDVKEKTPDAVEEEDQLMLEKEEAQQQQLSKDKIDELILDADEIEFGEDLDAITQVVVVPENEKRYSIDNQTTDMLDDLLASVPTTERTRKVLFDIHTTIERYKQLHKEYSKFDDMGNANSFIVKGSEHKPLTKGLKDFSVSVPWIIPVVTQSKKLYDIEIDEFDDNSDITPLTLAYVRDQEDNITQDYRSNNGPDSQNKYSHFYNELNNYYTPFEQPMNENYITNKKIVTDQNVIVNNSDDFDSTVANKEGIVQKKRFLSERYNKALTKLVPNTITTNSLNANAVPLTQNDTLFLKSFLFLPEPVVNFSRINLPMTSILQKTELHQNMLQLTQLLKKTTTITTNVVEDIDKDLDYDEEKYLKEFREVILNETIDHPDKFNKYLDSIIPRTKILFTLIKKHIKGTISFAKVVEYMEPFLIYKEDITYKQYQTIIHFLRKKIISLKKRYAKKEKEFSKLTNYRYNTSPIKAELLKVFSSKSEVYSTIPSLYDINEEHDSDSEILFKMKNIDLARLYMEALSFMDVDLQSSVDIQTELDKNVRIMAEKDMKRQSKCKNYVLAKKYKEIDALLDDNEKTIYFDRKYDDTRYDIIDEYSSQRETMGTEDFTAFLQQQLVANIGIDEKQAIYEATNMIMGKKIILEGHYCVLEVDDPRSELPNGKKYHYYRRSKNKWLRDAKIPATTYEDNSLFFCNVQDKCFSIDKKCDSLSQSKHELKKEFLQNLIENFEDSYQQSQENILENIKKALDYQLSIVLIRKENMIRQKYKYNTKQFQLGMLYEEKETVRSPYSKLRDMVLGQNDFTKKQKDILQISARYTREPDVSGKNENEYWRYCIESNVPLLPVFFVSLAKAFLETNNYKDKLDEICAQQGTISDDGDCWVDKYSGYVIRYIDYDTDEGYEESGAKTVSREKLEQDLGTVSVLQNNAPEKFESKETEMVHNVVHSLTGFIGIQIDSLDFISKNVLIDINERLGSEEKYERRVELARSKGKKLPPPYETVKNQYLLIFTIVYLFVSIQTAIPSVKTRKTFPGCVRSFKGMPLEGEGDESGLQYMACIAHKIKSSIKPWNTIRKNKVETIFERLKAHMLYVVEKTDVQAKINDKLEYLITNDDFEIPDEYSISKWTTFQPPLKEFKVKTVSNVSADFKKNITKYPDANLILRSKMAAHSLSIIESINAIVKKEKPILTNMLGEPFLENVCCNESEHSGIDYFMNIDKLIPQFNEIIHNMDDIYQLNRMIGKAPFLYHNENTKKAYPSYGTEFHEHSIFRAFIHYCKYNKNIPIPKELLPLCTNNVSDFKDEDNIEEKIRILRSEGRNYNNETLLSLLQIISRRGIIPIESTVKFVNKFQGLRDFIEFYRNEKQPIDVELLGLLNSNLDTFNVAIESTDKRTNQLSDYLLIDTEDKLDEILLFLRNNSELSKRKLKPILDFIKNITKWETGGFDSFLLQEDETNFKNITFIKNCIFSLINFFPNMIINEVQHSDIKIPKHWKLSQIHNLDIYNILSTEYEDLKEFYGNDVLNHILKLYYNKNQLFLTLMNLIPLYATIPTQSKKIKPIFNHQITKLIFKYLFVNSLHLFIKILDEPMIIMTKKTTEVEDFSEVDIQQGKVQEKKHLVANYLIKCVGVLINQQKSLNLNYDSIMEKVTRAKRKEREKFTTYGKDLNPDEMRVQNVMKQHKLERWSKGLEKGTTQYVQETYDEERKELEKDTLNEIKLGEIDDVTTMNQDIYMFELSEQERTEHEINAEINDLSHLAEDDDYGDRDGDEGY